jgi:hypothetical protein
MKDEHGKDMTRLGETTDHGGRLLEAPPDRSHLAIKVALDGVLVALLHARSGVACFQSLPPAIRTCHGTWVATFGGRAACGAP